MSKYIVYQNPNNNNMEILIPCVPWDGPLGVAEATAKSDVNDMNEVLKDIPKNQDGHTVEYKFIDIFPKYTETFDFINNNVVRNRNKLQEFKKSEWRRLRKGKLEKLDIEFMKSIETNNLVKQDEKKKKKQALRDVTDTDVSNLSDDDLENYIPEILLD